MEPAHRRLLFLFACIPLRALVAYGVYRSHQSPEAWKVVGLLALIGLGLVTADARRTLGHAPNQGAFGETVYWSSAFHGSLYLLAAFLLHQGNPLAWLPLAIDVAVGLALFAANTGISGSSQ